MEPSPSWEANRLSASQIPRFFYWTQRFITAFTSARQLSLSWASSIQSMPLHPTVCTFPLRGICPANLILFNFITQTVLSEEYKSLSSLLCSFLHSPVISSLLDPNIVKKIIVTNSKQGHTFFIFVLWIFCSIFINNQKMHWFLAIIFFCRSYMFRHCVSSSGSPSVPAELHANRMQWLIKLCVIRCYVSVMWRSGMHRSVHTRPPHEYGKEPSGSIKCGEFLD
jgi:hypothetical protein